VKNALHVIPQCRRADTQGASDDLRGPSLRKETENRTFLRSEAKVWRSSAREQFFNALACQYGKLGEKSSRQRLDALPLVRVSGNVKDEDW
jgi:hypothetical protein